MTHRFRATTLALTVSLSASIALAQPAGQPTAQPPATPSSRLRVLTINAWSGLDYQGTARFGEYEPAERREQRFAVLVDQIKALTPDVVFLQEANPVSRYAARLARMLGYSEIHQVENGGIKWTDMLREFYDKLSGWIDAAKYDDAPDNATHNPADAAAAAIILDQYLRSLPDGAPDTDPEGDDALRGCGRGGRRGRLEAGLAGGTARRSSRSSANWRRWWGRASRSCRPCRR
jgi:hypothetical protein